MVQFTIIGRLVQGDPHKAQPPSKDPRTKQTKIDARTGQPVAGQFFVAVAVPKNPADRIVVQGVPTWEDTKAALDAEAKSLWPQFFGTPASGLQIGAELPAGCTNPKFANKIIDGDGFDDKGQPYSAKEGYKGCWVVKIASQFAPKVYEWTASGWQETVHTGRIVKPGDYISVSGTSATNNSTESPGMYMNLGAVSFEREGPEIKSAAAVDPNAAFGARGAPANPPAAAAPAASPPPPAAGGQSSGTAAPTDTAWMAPPPPAPPAGAPVLTAKANGATYESFKAAGWSDDQLRANGYLA